MRIDPIWMTPNGNVEEGAGAFGVATTNLFIKSCCFTFMASCFALSSAEMRLVRFRSLFSMLESPARFPELSGVFGVGVDIVLQFWPKNSR